MLSGAERAVIKRYKECPLHCWAFMHALGAIIGRSPLIIDAYWREKVYKTFRAPKLHAPETDAERRVVSRANDMAAVLQAAQRQIDPFFAPLWTGELPNVPFPFPCAADDCKPQNPPLVHV